MSRSWREQVRISLAPHQVALVRLGRGVRGGVADRKVLAVENDAGAGFVVNESVIDGSILNDAVSNAATDNVSVGNGSNGHGADANGTGANWNGALETLSEMLAHPNIGRGRFERRDTSIVLSNHYVRYLVMPWSPELITPAEEAEFARMRFVQVFGEAANRWRVSLSPAAAGEGRVAAAVDQQLIDKLSQTMSGSSLRLRSVEPALMSQFNAWRRQIGDDAWVVLAERGRALIALVQGGEWRSVRARPLGESPLPLAQWLAQERLLLDAPAVPLKVCLSAVDDVAVNTEGVRVRTLSPRARNGFVPRSDAGLLLAMAGAA